jgi:hypothetical protein
MITFLRIGEMGRLANQMFQFSATIGTARSIGLRPVFPVENFHTNEPDSYSGCKLSDCFNIPSQYFLSRDEIIENVKFQYREPNFRFDGNIGGIPDNTNIEGYFQSEKYFSNCREEIKSCFQFRENIINEANEKFGWINFDDSVSVHVRRGDYINSPNHHPTQDVSYYRDSFSFYKGLRKIIFSDDPAWCEENLSGMDNCYIVNEDNPYVTLYLMTQFKNHIISNSSFSWWGAWLSSDSPSVVSPKKWFGPLLPHNTDDLYPEGWNVI